MPEEQSANPTMVLSLSANQGLVGVPTTDNGHDVTHFFAEDEPGNGTSTDETLAAALAAIGSWGDLDWQATIDALDRIRHESEPTPPIEGL